MEAGKAERKKRAYIAAAVTVFVLFVNLTPKLVYLNVTASLPLGLYLAIPGMSLRPGDIVIYKPTERVRQMVKERGYGTGEETFMKHVGALPGDIYGVFGDSLLINREKKGLVQRQDNAGNPMPVEEGWHVVPQGQFLPLGEKVNSLDGRYTGTVPIDSIITRAIPLLTEW